MTGPQPSEDTLLLDLIKTNDRTEGETMTKKQYRKHGDYNPWQARNRFGSWNEAKASAGIYKENTETEKVTEEELLDDLKQVKQSQGQIDIKTYREHGNHSPTTFYHKFSSFTEAVKKLDT